MRPIKAFSYANYPDRPIEIGDVICKKLLLGLVTALHPLYVVAIWSDFSQTMMTHEETKMRRSVWDNRDP